MVEVKETVLSDGSYEIEEVDPIEETLAEMEDDEEREDYGLSEVAHDENLAEYLTEEQLRECAATVFDGYEVDSKSRENWIAMLKRAMVALGVVPDDSAEPYKNASKIIHPGLGIGVTNFWARRVVEFWPPSGPIKTRVVGKPSEAIYAKVQNQAERVEDFINYQLLYEIPAAFEEDSKAAYDLPFTGNAFKKIYTDERGRVRDDYVHVENMILPYHATSIEETPRLTEYINVARAHLQRAMKLGMYRQVEIVSGTTEVNELEKTRQKAMGEEEPTPMMDDVAEDIAIIEQHTLYDFGEAPFPIDYIITLLLETKEILSIRRNWREGDPNYNRIQHYTHERMPGSGVYGFGFYHLASGLTDAQIAILRDLIDSGRFANMQGGIMTKDLGLPADCSFGPGEWKLARPVVDDLSKVFYPLNYKEPSSTLFRILEMLQTFQQKLYSTTDVPMGDIRSDMPVGTASLMVEQANRVPNGILVGVHRAKAREYNLIAERYYETMEEGVEYPAGAPGLRVTKEDFSPHVDIVPVSDPTNSSQAQRMTLAQTVLQMAQSPKSTINYAEAEKMMLEALRAPNIDLLLKQKEGDVDPRMQMEMEFAKQKMEREAQMGQADLAAKGQKMEAQVKMAAMDAAGKQLDLQEKSVKLGQDVQDAELDRNLRAASAQLEELRANSKTAADIRLRQQAQERSNSGGETE